MKKFFKRDNVAVRKNVRPENSDLLYKINQRLEFLEKKLDRLIEHISEGAPGGGNKADLRRERDSIPSERTALTRVVCAGCGEECSVPFKPSGDRPVYCRSCFSRQSERAPRGRARRPNR